MSKKKISWVTPDYFLDVDIPIVPNLLDEYDIIWIILFPWRNNRYKEEDLSKYAKKYNNLSIFFVHSKYFRYDPRTFFVYRKILKLIERSQANLIYFNIVLDNPLLYSLFKWLPKDKCVITAHDGSIKSIMGSVTKSMFRKCYPNCKYVNMFSESQAALFKINYPGPEIFVIPLALKDFGVPNVTLRNDCVSFVSFGTMHAEKNIQLIIEAANQLFEEGVRNFKVSINGVWRISDTPNQLIRYPEIFEIRNTLIPNNDIPNLFCSNHYAIYAYKEMSQSGAVKVAFNYYTPVIVSDLPGFKDEVEEDINGYFFKSENIDSLKDVMRKCIDKTTEDYNALFGRMRDNIDRKYSVKALLPKYKAMFSKVLNDE